MSEKFVIGKPEMNPSIVNLIRVSRWRPVIEACDNLKDGEWLPVKCEQIADLTRLQASLGGNRRGKKYQTVRNSKTITLYIRLIRTSERKS